MNYAEQAEKYLKTYLDDPSEENRAFLSDYGTKMFKAAARAKDYKDSEMEKIAKAELPRIKKLPGSLAGLSKYKKLNRSGAKYLFNRKMRCGLFLQMVALGKTLKEGTLESTLARLEEAVGPGMDPEDFILLVRDMLSKEFGFVKRAFKVDLSQLLSKRVKFELFRHEDVDGGWDEKKVEVTVYVSRGYVGVSVMGHSPWDDETSFRAQKLDSRRAKGVVRKARMMADYYERQMENYFDEKSVREYREKNNAEFRYQGLGGPRY